jgi:hypothetical protein
MNRIKAEELEEIDVHFVLKMKRSGRLTSLATYFTVRFNAGHTPVTFSTAPGPGSQSLWTQTIFFLSGDPTVEKVNMLSVI